MAAALQRHDCALQQHDCALQHHDCALQRHDGLQVTSDRARSCWLSTLRAWRTKRKRRWINRRLMRTKKREKRMRPMQDLRMTWMMAKMILISIAKYVHSMTHSAKIIVRAVHGLECSERSVGLQQGSLVCSLRSFATLRFLHLTPWFGSSACCPHLMQLFVSLLFTIVIALLQTHASRDQVLARCRTRCVTT